MRRILPKNEDRTPRSTRHWVSSPGTYLGFVGCIATESPEEVGARLRRKFPVYKFGKYITDLLKRGSGDEI